MMPTYISMNSVQYYLSIKVSTTVLSFRHLSISEVGTLLQFLPNLTAVDYNISRDFEVTIALESEEKEDDGEH